MKNLSFQITKALIAALYLIAPPVINAQEVELGWAKHIGRAGYSPPQIRSIVTDASGNVYATGSFYNTVDFDPGEGTANLESTGGPDIFISKLDANGNYLWAKRIGGSANDEGYSITVDPSGNVYITGYFGWNQDFVSGVGYVLGVDFDPGPGTARLESMYGNSNIFILKLDTNGNYVWARSMGSTDTENGSSTSNGSSIALDASGNVYTAGSFQRTVDFDPGEDEAYLTPTGGFSAFISKLDANGNYVWAKSIGSGSFQYEVYSIALDASGNVYTRGSFSGTADFDPGEGEANLTSAGPPEMFISKLDVNGNYLWAKKIRSSSIAVDASGNVYTTGNFSGTFDFDPGEGTANLESAGGSDIFVSKLDANGNYLWARSMGGSGYDSGSSIAVDASGNIYTTGSFNRFDNMFGSAVDFDPGESTAYLTAAGNDDIFISKLDAGGNYVWAKRIGAGGYDRGRSILIDASGHIYTTGSFEGTVDFDPNIGTFAMTAAGESDIFILKLKPREVSPVTVDAHFTTHLGWCSDCNQTLFKIEDANSRSQYLAYINGDALTPTASKFSVEWDGSQWKGQHSDKSYYTGGTWMSNPQYAFNGLNTAPKPPCTGWSNGFSLTGDCATPSVAVQAPPGAPVMNASAAQTTGLVNGKNAYEIPVTDGAPGEKVTVQWNATLSRWELVLVNPSARMSSETVLSYNINDAGANPPCGDWSNGYGLSGDICKSSSLPVSLLSFTAEATSANLVKLAWSTAAELNAGHFGIERSTDARIFGEIAKVAAKGDSYEIRSYIHTDETPLRGRSYYRLRQVDRDGSYTYSKVVSVRTTGTDAPYPNPAKGGTIRIEVRDAAALKLTDISGRNIPFTHKRIDEEVVELQPFAHLQPGVYVISKDGVGYRVVVE